MKAIVLAVILISTLGMNSGPVRSESQDHQLAWDRLAGEWVGHLSYRDFRTHGWVRIPHQRLIEVAPDQSWVSMRSSYSDPGREVHAFELLQQRGTAISIASTGEQAIEVRELVLSISEEAGQGWRIHGEATDDGRPARIEYRWQVRGDELTVETWVDYLDAGQESSAPFVRNRLELVRRS